ncbi:hypothetical protein D3C75_601750 [compost metagenome]
MRFSLAADPVQPYVGRDGGDIGRIDELPYRQLVFDAPNPYPFGTDDGRLVERQDNGRSVRHVTGALTSIDIIESDNPRCRQ